MPAKAGIRVNRRGVGNSPRVGGSRIRVYIATTEGPVAVQKITAEDPDVPSVACRDGTTEVLAISRDYTRFVDRGTGLVARLTGHGAYRLDLDGPVDGGRSWQLPVLLAHLLDAEDRLAGPEEPADLTLLATGEVDREQRVRPVGRIAQKLSAARALIDRHAGNGAPLVVLVPGGEGSPELAYRLPAGGGAVRLIAWDRVEDPISLEFRTAREEATPEAGPAGGTPVAHREADASAELDSSSRRAASPHGPAPEARAGVPAGAPAAGSRRPRAAHRAGVLLLLLLLAVAGTGIVAWWTGPRHWEALRRAGDYEALERSLGQALVPPLAERYRNALQTGTPPPESLVFGLVERRTADGRPCSGRFSRGAGGGDLAETPLGALKPGFFRSERGASLCEAVYRVANEGEHLAYLYFAVRPVLSGQTDGGGTEPLRRAAALPPGASLALELHLDGLPARPLGADLVILAVPSPAPQLRRAFESATGGEEAAEDAASLDLTALPGLGLTVKGASHAILR